MPSKKKYEVIGSDKMAAILQTIYSYLKIVVFNASLLKYVPKNRTCNKSSWFRWWLGAVSGPMVASFSDAFMQPCEPIIGPITHNALMEQWEQ